MAIIFTPKNNSTAIAEVYVDGVKISSADHNGIYQTLQNIKDYTNVWIGNCNVDNHGTNGWIRNVQIIPSGNVNSLYLRSGVESLSNGKITAKVTGSSSGQTVTKAGIIMSSGVDIVLTAVPNTGYYMSEMFLDQTTGATTSVMTKSASDAYTNPEYSFTFNNTSYTFATFSEREYTVVYNQNSDVTVGGQTTQETVTGMPTATDTKYKYFTDAFTFPPKLLLVLDILSWAGRRTKMQPQRLIPLQNVSLERHWQPLKGVPQNLTRAFSAVLLPTRTF